MPRIKVLIGLPCSFDVVPVPFVQSLAELRKPPMTETRFVRRATLDQMRNELAEMAVQGDFTHLFMLDVDMIYPQNSLMELLRNDVDIVCGIACRRTPPHVPVVAQPTGEPYVFRVEVPEKRGLIECGAVGGGGTLIKTDVFRGLKPPYFSFDVHMPDGKPVSEDFYFCQKARDAGYHVFCRTDINYPHLLTVAIAIDAEGNIGYRPIA